MPTDTCTVHRVVRVDERTGRRATPHTDPAHVERRRYTVYPERYHAWMRAQDMPLPPPAAHTRPDARQVSAQAERRLRIQYPTDGARYFVDPVLRDTYQRIHLRGTAPDAVRNVHWTVNGERHAEGLQNATWRLRPGHHRIVLRGRHDGQTVRSVPVRIRVVASSKTSSQPASAAP
jgi:penicillin-binding protein 1C